MCGLAGYIGEGVEADRLRAAADILLHRGPDGGGTWQGDRVGLAHRRLAILDPSPAGAQPMWSSSGRHVIVFNGEVYNFREIARELGIELRSGSDTEVILEGFERVGTALLPRLNGIFAFAIVDVEQGKAWLVRDRMGIKPLYLAEHGGRLLFASEIKAIFALEPDFPRRMATGRLAEWAWYGNALGGDTLFAGIDELAPGGVAMCDLKTGRVERSQYWSLREALADNGRSNEAPAALAERVRQTLEGAVERQLVSDVPVGVFLSGGIDSSAITAFAARHYGASLATFSVAFDYDRERSELARARAVAERFGTEHHEIDIAVSENLDAAETLIGHHDLPFSDAANIPLMLLSERVAPTHKVILQGDGGDELFGGYSRYRTIPRLMRWQLAARATSPFSRLLPNSPLGNRTRRYSEALSARDPAELVALLLTVERKSKPPTSIFGPAIREAIAQDDPFRRYREVLASFDGYPLADSLFYTDMSIILPDIFLPKVDRSTMARSVEVRVPFLDNAVVDLCLSLSASQKIPGGEQKGLLKRALKGTVPDEILFGRKRGFGVPFGKWIVGPLAERMDAAVESANAAIPALFDRERLHALRGEHRAGRADNGFILWKAYNLALWVNRFRVGLAAS
jgi:asparagine synthase (glutamine-hydrolysing)